MAVAKRAPSAPSATRWSKVNDSGSSRRGTIAPSRTTASSPPARHAEDGDLRVVDDRDGAGAAEGADVGDRERAATQVVQRGLALAHALGQGPQLALHVQQRLLSTSRITGTISPRSVATATPRWT